MKRCLAIVVLSVFLITYLLPVATLVKADVVIGDNNEVVVNQNAHILGRKLALMESIPNLLNTGVTELSISNANDLDEYLDSLWSELNDTVDYLTNGDWANDISIQLRNEALENISNYINYVGNRENIFANLLRDPTTQLLKEYVLGNNLPKTEYHPNYNTLNTFKKLSMINSGESTPTPPIDYSFVDIVGTYKIGYEQLDFSQTRINWSRSGNDANIYPVYNYSDYSYWVDGNGRNFNSSIVGIDNKLTSFLCIGFADVYINQLPNGKYGISLNFRPYTENTYWYVNFTSGNRYFNDFKGFYYYTTNNVFVPTDGVSTFSNIDSQYMNNHMDQYDTLSGAINYVYNRFRHINLYVDNELWVSAGNVNVSPRLDIDGFLTIYGDDNPVSNEIKTGTQIDYDALYDTIYNAIINALPVDNQDITYYDSHDTIYSPTIINNYGSDPDGENDWIESILDYAIVPEFDTALVEPISEPITNGTLIMVTGVSAIPEDILFVLGAAFVLILFACIINRMIE